MGSKIFSHWAIAIISKKLMGNCPIGHSLDTPLLLIDF
jgi:hypothetical protein